MKTIWRILKMAKPWRAFIIVATVTLFLIAAINLVTPMVVREVLSRLQDGSATTKIILLLSLGLLGIYILKAIFQFLDSFLAHFAAWNFVSFMRSKVYNHIQGLSLKFFQNKQTGQIMARIMEDTANFETLIAHTLPDFFISFLTFAGVLAMLFVINPVLAGLVCIPLPLILVTGVVARKLQKYFRKRKQISAELMGMLTDNIQGIKEIQVFNKQEFESGEISGKASQHAKMSVRATFWMSVMNPLMGMMQGLGTITIILAGGLLAIYGNSNLNVADIAAFMLYIGMLYAPVASFARIMEDAQEAITSGKRILEILDEQSAVQDSPDARNVGILNGEIEFNNVSFNYNAEAATLSDISFTIPTGKMVALVGPTGAGKSTITSLLARFFDVTDGAITIDKIDTRDMTLESLRNNISVVLQDVFLFNGTILDNIVYGRNDEVPFDEVVEAAKAAAVHEFISTLPDGYQTQIGERGTRLSGGQKQRIAIARAILRKSPILIFDEATSAVDNETEREIQEAINTIAGKRTMLVIAHRLSTVKKADEILYLENGRIIERGTHKQLLARNGRYANMQNSVS